MTKYVRHRLDDLEMLSVCNIFIAFVRHRLDDLEI